MRALRKGCGGGKPEDWTHQELVKRDTKFWRWILGRPDLGSCLEQMQRERVQEPLRFSGLRGSAPVLH